jgi:penicillin-binding protein 2
MITDILKSYQECYGLNGVKPKNHKLPAEQLVFNTTTTTETTATTDTGTGTGTTNTTDTTTTAVTTATTDG